MTIWQALLLFAAVWVALMAITGQVVWWREITDAIRALWREARNK